MTEATPQTSRPGVENSFHYTSRVFTFVVCIRVATVEELRSNKMEDFLFLLRQCEPDGSGLGVV